MRFAQEEKELFISTGRAARYLSVHVTTLQRWDREGKLSPRRLPSGHRRYSVRELDDFMRQGLAVEDSPRFDDGQPRAETTAVIYCRFPGLHPGSGGEVESRIRSLARKAESMGLHVSKVITEVGSGVDDDRKGLNDLLDFVSENPGTVVVVKSRNHLATVGWGFLRRFLDTQGCRVVEAASAHGTAEKELLYDDIMNLADRLRTMVNTGPAKDRQDEAGASARTSVDNEHSEGSAGMP